MRVIPKIVALKTYAACQGINGFSAKHTGDFVAVATVLANEAAGAKRGKKARESAIGPA